MSFLRPFSSKRLLTSPSARSPVRERLRVGELARESGGGKVFLETAQIVNRLFNSSFGSTPCSKGRRSDKKTMVSTNRPGRGETPANQADNPSPEGVTDLCALRSAAPSGLKLPPHICRGFTPACCLNAPSGLCGKAYSTSET